MSSTLHYLKTCTGETSKVGFFYLKISPFPRTGKFPVGKFLWVSGFPASPNKLQFLHILNIFRENLNLSYKAWYFKAALVNCFLIIIVMVYSTPVTILNVVNRASNFTANFTSNGTVLETEVRNLNF